MKLHLPTLLCCALLASFISTTHAADYTAQVGSPNTNGYGAIYVQTGDANPVLLNNDAGLTSSDTITFDLSRENKGYFSTTFSTDANVEIVNLTLTNGSTGATYTFNGTLSSASNAVSGGSITYAAPSGKLDNLHLVFTGDVSGFTGSMDMTDSNQVTTDSGSTGHTLTFTNNSGAARSINASSLKAPESITFNGSSKYTVSSDITTKTLNVSTATVFTGTQAVTAETVNVSHTQSGVNNRVTGKFNATTLTKTGDGELIVNEGSSIGSLTISQGTIHTYDDTTYGDVTVTGGTFQAASHAYSTTVTGTLRVGSKLEITAKGDGAEIKNFKFDTGTLQRLGTNSTSHVNNADIIVKENYNIRDMDLSESTVTIKTGNTLTSGDSSSRAITLGALTVEAGAKLAIDREAGINYTGAINLTLGTGTFTAPTTTTTNADGYVLGYSTNALPGEMGEDAALTLNFGTISLEDSVTKICFTFTGLTGMQDKSWTANVDESYTPLATDFNISGWNVDKIDAANEDGILLYLSRPGSSNIPEPTTATLSLLALAGLAARRRRK